MPDQPNQQPPAPQPPVESPGAAAVAEAPPAVKRAPAPPKVDQLPPFRVLLHNDDHNAFDHVIGALMELVRFTVPRAVEVTMEAHRTGVALVIVCHLERAELLREQFQSKGLTSTIEKAE